MGAAGNCVLYDSKAPLSYYQCSLIGEMTVPDLLNIEEVEAMANERALVSAVASSRYLDERNPT